MGRKPKKGFDSEYREGMSVSFHLNPYYLQDTELLGRARLIEMLEEASTNDAHIYPEEDSENLVRSLEKWRMIVISVTPLGESHNYNVGDTINHNLSMLYGKGHVTSGRSSISLKHAAGQITYRSERIDSFLTVDGIEIY